MDILALLQVADNAAGRQNPVTTIADAIKLYGLFQDVKAGKLDLSAMAKAGTLEPDIAAIARTAALADALLKDATQGPRLVSLLASIA